MMISKKKNIFAIIGSASANSSNLKLVEYIAQLSTDQLDWTIFNELKSMLHFDPELSSESPPPEIIDFRNNGESADGIVIYTPEYVSAYPVA